MKSLFPIARAILFVALFILIIAFAVQNSDEIRVDLFQYEAYLSISLLISVSFGAGIIIGVLVMTVPLFKLRWQLHKLRRQIRRTEKQQNISITPSLSSSDQTRQISGNQPTDDPSSSQND